MLSLVAENLVLRTEATIPSAAVGGNCVRTRSAGGEAVRGRDGKQAERTATSGQRLCQRINLLAGPLLGEGDQQRVALVDLGADVEAGPSGPGAEIAGTAARSKRELVEERPVVGQRQTVNRTQLLGGVVRLLQAQFGDLPQSLRTYGGEVDRGPQRQQSLIGADVARGLVPADVLLARLQAEHVTGLAVA